MSSSSNWIKVYLVTKTEKPGVVFQKSIEFGSDDTNFEHDGLFFTDLHDVFGEKIENTEDFVGILKRLYPASYLEKANDFFASVDWASIEEISIKEWIGDGSDILEAIDDDMEDIELVFNAREIFAIYKPEWNKWCFERYVEADEYDNRMYQEDRVDVQ